jgi:hypothetical protein
MTLLLQIVATATVVAIFIKPTVGKTSLIEINIVEAP